MTPTLRIRRSRPSITDTNDSIESSPEPEKHELIGSQGETYYVENSRDVRKRAARRGWQPKPPTEQELRAWAKEDQRVAKIQQDNERAEKRKAQKARRLAKEAIQKQKIREDYRRGFISYGDTATKRKSDQTSILDSFMIRSKASRSNSISKTQDVSNTTLTKPQKVIDLTDPLDSPLSSQELQEWIESQGPKFYPSRRTCKTLSTPLTDSRETISSTTPPQFLTESILLSDSAVRQSPTNLINYDANNFKIPSHQGLCTLPTYEDTIPTSYQPVSSPITARHKVSSTILQTKSSGPEL